MASRMKRWLASLRDEVKLVFPAIARGPIAIGVAFVIALTAFVVPIASELIVTKLPEVGLFRLGKDTLSVPSLAIESFDLEMDSPFNMGAWNQKVPKRAVIVRRGRERETLTQAPTYWDNAGKIYNDYLFPEDKCVHVKPLLRGRWDIDGEEWALPVFDVILKNNTDNPLLIKSVSTETLVHIVQSAAGGDIGETSTPLKSSAQVTIALPSQDAIGDKTARLADPIVVPGRGFMRLSLGLTYVIREFQEDRPVQWYGSFLFKGDGSYHARTGRLCVQFPGMEALEQKDIKSKIFSEYG